MKTDLEFKMDVLDVRHSPRVEATDGYVGQVDELLINANNRQVTHLVLRERHALRRKEIIIPVSQIDHVYEDIIFLKLDRQNLEKLTIASPQRPCLFGLL